jgi:hypothetical protein
MGELTRKKDWSATSLGPSDSWPQSLRTTLSIVLNSRLPMFLFWGPDLISFYNDSFRPSLGNNGKHPSALGLPGERVWPEIWAFIKPLIDLVIQKREAVWMEDQLVPFYRNGQIEDIFWTFSYSPIEDESGEVAGVFVSCYETTKQLHAISELKASEQRFKNLIREADLGVIILSGADMVVEVVNEAYGRLIDRLPEELLGKPLFEVIPDAEDPFRQILDQVRSTGNPVHLFSFPYMVYKDEKKIEGFLDITYQPYKEADGSITGIVALCHDVTERTTARNKIIDAEAKARMAIDSADLGTYEIDLLTDNMVTSERFNAIWGIPHAMHRSRIVDRIHPEDQALRIAAHKTSLQTGHLEYEVRVIWPDQAQHWVRVRGTVIYDTAGKATSLIGVVQDITGQKQFAEELARQVQDRTLELQRSNDDLLQFAHVISHDLKEPVRKIKIYNSRIQDELGTGLPAQAHSYLNRIKNAAERMSSMIEGVLNYSSVSASDESIETVNLNEVFDNIDEDLEVLIQQKQARIVRETLPTIVGARVLIYQLFYNIVNNSLKFAKQGVPVVITVSWSLSGQRDRQMAEITLEDNGIGFPAEQAQNIFHTFTRLHSKDRFEGTGLGLALSKKITERHGGGISAAGWPGVGARIVVTLPLKHNNRKVNE